MPQKNQPETCLNLPCAITTPRLTTHSSLIVGSVRYPSNVVSPSRPSTPPPLVLAFSAFSGGHNSQFVLILLGALALGILFFCGVCCFVAHFYKVVRLCGCATPWEEHHHAAELLYDPILTKGGGPLSPHNSCNNHSGNGTATANHVDNKRAAAANHVSANNPSASAAALNGKGPGSNASANNHTGVGRGTGAATAAATAPVRNGNVVNNLLHPSNHAPSLLNRPSQSSHPVDNNHVSTSNHVPNHNNIPNHMSNHGIPNHLPNHVVPNHLLNHTSNHVGSGGNHSVPVIRGPFHDNHVGNHHPGGSLENNNWYGRGLGGGHPHQRPIPPPHQGSFPNDVKSHVNSNGYHNFGMHPNKNLSNHIIHHPHPSWQRGKEMGYHV